MKDLFEVSTTVSLGWSCRPDPKRTIVEIPVLLPVSAGEYFDRYNILQLKARRRRHDHPLYPRAAEAVERHRVAGARYWLALREQFGINIAKRQAKDNEVGERLIAKLNDLQNANSLLWNLETNLRTFASRLQSCDGEPSVPTLQDKITNVALAISQTNDKRCECKHAIDELFFYHVDMGSLTSIHNNPSEAKFYGPADQEEAAQD